MFVVLSGRLVSRFRRIGRGRMHPGMNDVLSRGTALVGLWRGGIAIPAGTAFDPKRKKWTCQVLRCVFATRNVT
jgi:hypothetical protein